MLRRALLALALLAAPAAAQEGPVTSERATFRVTTFATGLERPWGAVFLPDGTMLVTERPGRLRRIGTDGRVSAPLGGVPQVDANGQGGLLDIALAPDFARTREVFLCQSALVEGGSLTRLVVARLSPATDALTGVRRIIDAGPPQESGRLHYGCRIVFGPEGHIFLSTGERNERARAQRLDDLAGKVLRLTRDGRVPPDNPFVGRADARPEIWSYGHRHPQGLAFNPWTGSLWEAEFGPRGGDEINVIRRGANYGWPVVSHGREYWGPRISREVSAPGMEDPIHVWVPSVSPSGITFYDGAAFPGWRGSLFAAAQSTPGLVRLTTDGDRVTGEERLFWGKIAFRHQVVGPDGRLYLLTDENEGRILRLDPA
ncbi:PQQ-dependent sugar dehydrogenase [Neoroseomonas oryzicola]|uniref:PQQ-dependent sugar dehydrogenase n=1 Tax=Neoroseomonas oryzicola TaxID=535904 RepID=A0A9X9WJT7_9PROT|nr:PQQ-dependent sugar dehydrogenase [Neoroseomonas oryzicola]MBR0660597.1 PQQ-dependent sugar dehydrogenase [Neoroseomonas oryzicola]NKE16860.1 PQQ-dependent sugar dehydrogenase [Neoroseomonas oryzicola]